MMWSFKTKIFWAIWACLLFSGCEMMDYHPYDVRISGETGINARNMERIEKACAGKTVFRFALMSDSQGWYDETKDFVDNLNKRTDVDFVVHAGDISDYGVTKEFLWQRDILAKLDVPYVVLIGNHDCIGTGDEVYRTVFGNTNFSFIAGNVKFVCLNTNALEYDYSEPIPDFEYLSAQRTERGDEFSKTIVCMHARPYSDVFNNNVAKVFERYVKDLPGLLFCLNGHDHSLQADELFDDGVMYYGAACMQKRCYILFTIKPEGYDYEVVYY